MVGGLSPSVEWHWDDVQCLSHGPAYSRYVGRIKLRLWGFYHSGAMVSVAMASIMEECPHYIQRASSCGHGSCTVGRLVERRHNFVQVRQCCGGQYSQLRQERQGVGHASRVHAIILYCLL